MSKKEKNVRKQLNRSHLKFVFADNEAIRFDVDEEQKVVICSIDGGFSSTFPIKEAVERVFKRNGLSILTDYDYDDEVLGVQQFVSTVKCNENDTFDATTGKRLAESKCKAKIYVKAMKLIGEIAEECEKEIHTLKNLGAKYLGFYAKEKMHQFKVDLVQNGEYKK